jgi:hypothetical protein
MDAAKTKPAKKGPWKPPQPVIKRGPTALVKNRGTGFEGASIVIVDNCMDGHLTGKAEYYADPPMRPDEAAEEKNKIYNP